MSLNQKIHQRIRFALHGSVVTIFLCLSGCSWFEAKLPEQVAFEPFQSPANSPTPESPVQAEHKEPSPELPQFIEVTWEIPADKVESYVIRYGTEKDHLDKEVRLHPGDIQKVHHEKYGDVFRYLLPNPPRDKTVYVSVAAVSSSGESAPSRVFEVAPEQSKTPTPERSPQILAPIPEPNK